METPQQTRYRARRDDRPDLSFTGVKLAEVNYRDETDRLYRTDKNKIVYSTKVDDRTGDDHYDAFVFESLDAFLAHLEKEYGPYSYRMKNLLAEASKIDASLRRYFVEEI